MTALEWLENQLKSTYMIEGKLPLAYTLDLVRQAKEMEKEQIKEAWLNGDNDSMYEPKQLEEHAEEYYKETYGK